MAHWAKLDENNVVIDILVTIDDDYEAEKMLVENFGGVWKKTSYNTKSGIHLLGGVPFRKNYATIGGVYDEAKDAFIPPKPEITLSTSGRALEFILNEDTCDWEVVD